MSDDETPPLVFVVPNEPLQPPSPRHHLVEPGALDVGSLAKERELRELRAANERLKEELTESQKRLVAPLTARMPFEEKQHTFKCGLHPLVEVSLETNSVSCRVCGVELAPLDVLRDYARNERYFVQGLESLREEKKKLSIEVDALKKQRSSLRSQIRKKGGDVPDDPNVTRPSTAQYYKVWSALQKATQELNELRGKVAK